MNRTKGKRDFPQEFKLANGNIISDPKEIANAFNDFFISIGDTALLNANRDIDFNQYMPLKTNCTLIFQTITIDTTSRIIDSLKPKTSTGVDCVSNKLLKFAKKCYFRTPDYNYQSNAKSRYFPRFIKDIKSCSSI